MVGQWNKLPREVVESLPLGICEKLVDVILRAKAEWAVVVVGGQLD